jgi:hypothetical protein
MAIGSRYTSALVVELRGAARPRPALGRSFQIGAMEPLISDGRRLGGALRRPCLRQVVPVFPPFPSAPSRRGYVPHTEQELACELRTDVILRTFLPVLVVRDADDRERVTSALIRLRDRPRAAIRAPNSRPLRREILHHADLARSRKEEHGESGVVPATRRESAHRQQHSAPPIEGWEVVCLEDGAL